MPDKHVAHRVRQRRARNEQHNDADGNFIDVQRRHLPPDEPDKAARDKADQHLEKRGVAEHGLYLPLHEADHRADEGGKDAVSPGAAEKERKAQRRHNASQIQRLHLRLLPVDFFQLRAKFRRAHRLGADAAAERVEPLELDKVKRRRFVDAARLCQLHAVFKQNRQYNIGCDGKDVYLLCTVGSSEPRHGVFHAVDFRAAQQQHLPHVQKTMQNLIVRFHRAPPS